MRRLDPADLDVKIALARVALSIAALISVWVDPTVPDLTLWIALGGGPFAIDRFALATLSVHLAYSGAAYFAIVRRLSLPKLVPVSKIADIMFAVAIAVVTEGSTSPAYMFFAFAIIAVGCREGFHKTLIATFWGAALYLALIFLSASGHSVSYVMRPVYLAITGYLIGFLGQQRVDFEARILQLEAQADRHSIARSLHDGYVQALAGVNLRLESCRELVRRGDTARALDDLTDLQRGVAREYDEVRRYVRSLAGREQDSRAGARSDTAQLALAADVCASAGDIERMLQILLEGTRNIIRHARAGSGGLTVARTGDAVRITIEDDGVGIAHAAEPPWSISSRVREAGGKIRVASTAGSGARLEIELPGGTPS